VLYLFFIHQACGGITQRQEAVILRTHAVAVAWERIDKQLQLVVSPLGNMDSHAPECILQMIGRLLQIGIIVAAHYKVVMRIYQLLSLPGHDFLHLLDVLYGHLVARIGNTGVAVFLLFQ